MKKLRKLLLFSVIALSLMIPFTIVCSANATEMEWKSSLFLDGWAAYFQPLNSIFGGIHYDFEINVPPDPNTPYHWDLSYYYHAELFLNGSEGPVWEKEDNGNFFLGTGTYGPYIPLVNGVKDTIENLPSSYLGPWGDHTVGYVHIGNWDEGEIRPPELPAEILLRGIFGR